MDLSNDLKERLKDLGAAISAALSDSPSIAEAIAGIKDQGYDLFLVLEATIGLSRNVEESATASETTSQKESGEFRLHITASDKKFLEALRIQVEDAKPQEISGSPEESA